MCWLRSRRRQPLPGGWATSGLHDRVRCVGPLVLALCLAWAMAGCGTHLPTPEPVALTLVVPDSVAPLAGDLASAYRASHPHVTVRIEPVANSLAAEARLAQGRANVALVTQQPELAAQQPLTATQLAWDAVALIVPSSSPLTALTLEQARQIFTGKVRNWSELGNAPKLLQPVVREDGAGARAVFDAAVLAGRQLTPTARILPGEQAMLDYVARTPGAIGYVSAAWLEALPPEQRNQVRALAIDGAPPDPSMAVANGYPLRLPVYIVTPANVHPAVAELVAWVHGPAGQGSVQQRYERIVP